MTTPSKANINRSSVPEVVAYERAGSVPVENWSAQKKALWQLYEGCWEGTVQVTSGFCTDRMKRRWVCCLDKPAVLNATFSFSTLLGVVPVLQFSGYAVKDWPLSDPTYQIDLDPFVHSPRISISHFDTLDGTKNGVFMAYLDELVAPNGYLLRNPVDDLPPGKTMYKCSRLNMSDDGDTLVIVDYRFPVAFRRSNTTSTFKTHIYGCPDGVGSLPVPVDFESAPMRLSKCPTRFKPHPPSLWNGLHPSRLSTRLATLRRVPEKNCFCDGSKSCIHTLAPSEGTYADENTSRDATIPPTIEGPYANENTSDDATITPTIEGAYIDENLSDHAPIPPTIEGVNVDENISDDTASGGSSEGGIEVGTVAGVAGSLVTIVICIVLGIMFTRSRCCRRRQAKLDVHAPDLEPSLPIQTECIGRSTVVDHGQASELNSLSFADTEELFKNADHLQSIMHYAQEEHWLLDGKTIALSGSEACGNGAYGTVVKAKLHGTTHVAIKIPLLASRSSHHLAALMNEVRLFRRLRHPNIILFHGVTVLDVNCVPTFSIVLEFMAGGDMAHFIRSRRKQVTVAQVCCQELPAEEWKLLQDVARGLSYLHAQSPAILHRDLKPSNVLVELVDPPKAKLTDFGLSLVMALESASTRAGTKLYMAPEVAAETPYDVSADTYSFGCLCYYGLVAQHPEDKHTVLSTLTMLAQEGTFLRSCALAKLALKCLMQNPEMRPTMTQVFQAFEGVQDQVVGRVLQL